MQNVLFEDLKIESLNENQVGTSAIATRFSILIAWSDLARSVQRHALQSAEIDSNGRGNDLQTDQERWFGHSVVHDRLDG